MACNCHDTTNEKLKENGSQLYDAIFFGGGELTCRPAIPLVRLDTRRLEKRCGKPKIMVLSYCPFCGTKYEEKANG